MPDEEMISIPVTMYNELMVDADLLLCLRAAGVDNWAGWDFAIEAFHELRGE